MRLVSVRIEGFRSVKRPLDIPMDPRVTVLLGPNDHGKTNILRALTHLQPDRPLASDDCNWDLSAKNMPQITYQLDVTDVDRRRAVTMWTSANPTAAAADKPKFTDVPARITLVRSMDSAELSFTDASPPDVLAPYVLRLVPRVELFEAEASIPDAATAAEIELASHEFLQGIFLYAGLRREEWPALFSQDDVTLKRLETATRTLNKTIKRDWSQGQDLEFELRHDSATSRIALYIKDPAVKSRWVRASQKSSGFTHYFALRTRLYARARGKRDGLYMWLFDEPGVWLHPAGQFDLIQAIEALAQTSQIVYSTHSIFMINRNYPARHRLVVKSVNGTGLDAKPYVSRWNAALDALGFSISGTLLFAPCVVLTEGDSDPVLMYALFQKLAAAGVCDRDINSLSLMATGDPRNAEAIARLLLQGAHKPSVAILVDGDQGGAARSKALTRLQAETKVPVLSLPADRETEDYLPGRPQYLEAVAEAAADAAERASGPILEKLVSRHEAWLKTAPSGGLAAWATGQAQELAGLDSAPSKVVIARLWAAKVADLEFTADELALGVELATLINDAVRLPARANDSALS